MDALLELGALEAADSFVARHIGPSETDIAAMLATVGAATLADLAARTVPGQIQSPTPLDLPPAIDEAAAIAELRALAAQNVVKSSLIGQGYHGTVTPPVILRNVLENPGWYTAYTPYQAELAQGRLEALLNYQTMVCDLTGMPIANASLLDEGTAAAEAVTMAHAASRTKSTTVAVCTDLHPQTRAVLATRAVPAGLTLVEFAPGDTAAIRAANPLAVVLQYPGTTGAIRDLHAEITAAHDAGGLAIVCTDLLSLVLLTPPGRMGADVVVGSSQRFGVPMGFGGPHAAFFATRDQHKRQMPGRLVGISQDAAGNPALRLALQTREQHIRREKATSNICTAQVLLAVIAGMYAVWHGPEGLVRIARRLNLQARLLAAAATSAGATLRHHAFFDTVALDVPDPDALIARAAEAGYNLRRLDGQGVALALDETISRTDLDTLAQLLGAPLGAAPPSIPRRAGPRRPRPAATRLQPLPRRARDAPLPKAPGGQGRRTQPQHDPARLLHHEAQRHRRDDAHHPAGLRRHPPARTRRPDPRLRHPHRAPVRLALRRHRLRRRLAAAQRRQPGRIRRPARHPRLPPRKRRRPPRHLPHPQQRPRHQPGQRRHGRLPRRRHRLRPRRQRRPRRPPRQGRAARRPPRRPHGHLPQHPRRVRGHHPGGLRDRPRPRRPGLHGRRQHERPGRPHQPRPHRCGRLPPQPAQDLLHPPRRRRTRRRPHRRRRPPRPTPPQPPRPPRRRPRHGPRPGRLRPLRQRADPAHQLRLHPHDGRPRPHPRHRGRHPLGQLHGRPPSAPTTPSSTPARTAWSPTSASSTAAASRPSPASRSKTSPSASRTTASMRRP